MPTKSWGELRKSYNTYRAPVKPKREVEVRSPDPEYQAALERVLRKNADRKAWIHAAMDERRLRWAEAQANGRERRAGK